MATGYEPEQIRALRGRLSRVAFAKRLRVTALTVYRWELPVTAAESRRPRGSVLARLNDYARDSGSTQTIVEVNSAPIGADALVDAIQRLTVRGMTPASVVRELSDVLVALFPGAVAQLEEIGTDNGGVQASSHEVVELSDGSGRRLRVSASRLSPDAFEMLKSVAQVAGLAVEVAELRDRLQKTLT